MKTATNLIAVKINGRQLHCSVPTGDATRDEDRSVVDQLTRSKSEDQLINSQDLRPQCTSCT